MRENLKLLPNNAVCFWVYLWLSDESEFDMNKLMKMFKCSRKTITRYLEYGKQFTNPTLNLSILYGSKFKIEWNFANELVRKKITKPKKPKEPIDELFEFCKEFYNRIGYDYPDLPKQKEFIRYIVEKIRTILISHSQDSSSEAVNETFIVFMNNIPEWWINNKVVSLPSINKHFAKIFNSIKNARQTNIIDDNEYTNIFK